MYFHSISLKFKAFQILKGIIGQSIPSFLPKIDHMFQILKGIIGPARVKELLLLQAVSNPKRHYRTTQSGRDEFMCQVSNPKRHYRTHLGSSIDFIEWCFKS